MKRQFFPLLLILSFNLSAQTIEAITFNIRFNNPNDGANAWENRKAEVASMLRYYAPDILGTQEGLLDQIEYLDSALQEMKYVGVGRDDGKQKGEFCAVFYNTNRFELKDSGTFWLSETPEKISIGWDAALERICTYLLLHDQNGQLFYVFNTHFDHVGQQAREASAKLIIEKIKEINDPDYPVLLMGDFNLPPDAEAIKYLQRELEDPLQNSVTLFHGPIGTFNGFDTNRVMERRIDYIFQTGFQVLRYRHIDDRRTENLHISDHLAVYAELNY
jgi:endonuclease/exonuclease/phosphatase family metal-dependent hydrolase